MRRAEQRAGTHGVDDQAHQLGDLGLEGEGLDIFVISHGERVLGVKPGAGKANRG